MVNKDSKSKKRVIIVDDDDIQMITYKSELASRGIDVTQLYPAAECLEFLRSGDSADLFIIDVMLPHYPYSIELSEQGKYTGLLLAQDIRRILSDPSIIFFSNTASEYGRQRITNGVKALGNAAFIKKWDFGNTSEFGDVILNILKEGIGVIERSGIWSKLKGSIRVSPRFFYCNNSRLCL